MPCAHLSPSVITSHLDESIITGTLATSGSLATRLRKVVISALASSSPSSMLMSITCAPSATCFRAMARASSYFFSFIRRRNLREPATLHLSPTFTNPTSGVTSSNSSPLSHIVPGSGCGCLGVRPSTNGTYLSINSSVVPQHPPMIFTSPSSIYSAICGAMVSAVSSYSPSELGSPAFGWQLT